MRVQDKYQLSPLQEGMLFQHLLDPGAGVDIVQVVCSLVAPVDEGLLHSAWLRVVERHPVLRTAFVWADSPAPVQVVRAATDVPWHVEDWRNLAEDARSKCFERFLSADRTIGFRLDEAPAIRLTLIHWTDTRSEFVWTCHHAILDGRALRIVLREVFAIYEATLAGSEVCLDEPRSYRDYVQAVRGADEQAMKAFWHERLRGFRAPNDAPLISRVRRPSTEARQGDAVRVLSPGVTEGLRALSRDAGVSLNVIVQAAWAVLLWRHSGQDDIVFGAIRATHRVGTKDYSDVVGLCINTLPVRIRIDASAKLGDWLRTVRDAWQALRPFEHTPLPVARAASEVKLDGPLFRTLVCFDQVRSRTTSNGRDATGDSRDLRILHRTSVPLALFAYDGESLALQLDYDRALADHATADRLLAQLATVFEGMAHSNVGHKVDRLSLLGSVERTLLVTQWNATESIWAEQACVHELIAAQAALTPGAVAVVTDKEQLTYQALDEQASRLARQLSILGVGPHARVAVCLERHVHLVVALLAVLKAGGAYVPLDPGYPEERLRFSLLDSAPVVVLGEFDHTVLRDLTTLLGLSLLDPRAVALSGSDETTSTVSSDVYPPATPKHPAYVIYTSGSTGTPKGVVVSQRSLTNLLLSMQDLVHLRPTDRLMATTTIAFDIAALELFLPLLVGARTILTDRTTCSAPELLGASVLRHAATLMQATPTTWRMLLDAGWTGAPDLHALCGGEALPADLAARLKPMVASLRNMYGPTETTVWSTTQMVTMDTDTIGTHVAIGRPIANTQVYVLDPAGDPLPVGVAGELYIGGVGVAEGYLRRPGLTAQRFVPDGFSGSRGTRLYRTGDQVRWQADGSLEFLGRLDDQVKLHGYRIEPGEIEAVLTAHPNVRTAAIVARDDRHGIRRLVAYVVAEDSSLPVLAESLKGYLFERLPAYMVPVTFVTLDALPLTPNGKVDRRALPAPVTSALVGSAYIPPEGEVEISLATIWEELLSVERVGRHDHFFNLGGHSLLAVRIVANVRQVLRREVGVADLFQHPMLADFAKVVASALFAPLPAIEPVSRPASVPLSFAQQRLWFLEQIGTLGATYHIARAIKLSGPLDVCALRAALDAVIARHEALRTTFGAVDGIPVQHITGTREYGFALQENNLEHEDEREAKLARLAATEAQEAFDLAKGPLIRGRLVRLEGMEHMLLLTIHHIVADGWSIGILLDDIGTSYAALLVGAPITWPALPLQFADYAAWQRRWVDRDVLEEQRAYWQKVLTGAPELLELPVDRPRPALQDYAGAFLNVELDAALTAKIKEMTKRLNATLFQTLLATWATLLGRLSGQDVVVVGVPMANRGRPELDRVVGLFSNTLALRVDLSGAPTVSELVTRVRERTLEAQRHEDLPFDQVVEIVQPVRSLAHTPLFQVMFSWNGAPHGGLDMPGLSVVVQTCAHHASARVDLSLTLGEQEGRIVGGVEYATALFDVATVERYIDYFTRLLHGFVADATSPIDEVPLLTMSEQAKVLAELNTTDESWL